MRRMLFFTFLVVGLVMAEAAIVRPHGNLTAGPAIAMPEPVQTEPLQAEPRQT